MYAIIETGGKQFKVSVGDTIDVEKLDNNEGEQVEFGKVLLVKDGEESKIGSPCLEGVKVVGRIVRQGLGRKVVVFKFKRRKNYRRLKGHRQPFSKVRIEQIVA